MRSACPRCTTAARSPRWGSAGHRRRTALLERLRGTGASRVLVHFDVDTVDADEVRLGLGYDAGGLTSTQARRVVADVAAAAEVVALTVAEHVPRQVVHLQRLLRGFPLLG